MEILRVLGICIITAVLGVILTGYKKEYALIISTAAGAIILINLLSSLLKPLFELRDLIVDAGVSSAYFLLAFKTLGICLITGFVSDLCRDFGQTALGSLAEMAGKCSIFIVSLPVLSELLRTAYSFIITGK